MRAGSAPTASIFDIQRFCVHDGPGIRTTVFFKGCNLRCAWCHNPESLSALPEIQFYPDKCIGCGACYAACPTGALTTERFERALCTGCGACAEVCYAGARVLAGKRYTVDEVLDIVRRDTAFYKNSGGGLTCSGGEAMLQSEFLSALLRRAKSEGLHTAIDTAGCVPWANFEAVLPHTDLFLYDIKAADAALHALWIGRDNALILENLGRLAKGGARVWIRIPVIPGVNAAPEAIRAIGEEIRRLGAVERVELNAYHPLGEGKYHSLGRAYPMPDGIKPPSGDQIEELRHLLRDQGLPVR